MIFDGQRIVILGGSSGIGLATAQAAAHQGGKVVIASSRRARIETALETLPAGTEGHAVDLANEDAVKALFSSLGPFDHLVFTAGDSLEIGRLQDIDLATARRFFNVRYWGAYMAAKYGSGSIRPAARSPSRPDWRACGPMQAGRSGRASAPRWRGSPGLSPWNSRRFVSTSSRQDW